MRRFSAFLPGANVAPNPSFETSLDDWIFSKTANRIAGGVHGGFCAEVAVATGTNDYSSSAIARVAALPGQVWSGQVWISGGSPEAYLNIFDAGFSVADSIGPLAPIDPPINGFRRYRALSLTASPDRAWVQMTIYNQSAAAVMLIDAVSLVQEA